mgnify:CR=1 FL=1
MKQYGCTQMRWSSIWLFLQPPQHMEKSVPPNVLQVHLQVSGTTTFTTFITHRSSISFSLSLLHPCHLEMPLRYRNGHSQMRAKWMGYWLLLRLEGSMISWASFWLALIVSILRVYFRKLWSRLIDAGGSLTTCGTFNSYNLGVVGGFLEELLRLLKSVSNAEIHVSSQGHQTTSTMVPVTTSRPSGEVTSNTLRRATGASAVFLLVCRVLFLGD